MNFQNTEEQDRLRNSIRAALGRAGPGGAISTLAELGAFGLTVGEEVGGSGLGMVEAAIVLQEAGRIGLRYPLAETVMVAGNVVANRPETAHLVLAGELPVAAAVTGRLSRQGSRLGGTLTFSDTGAATSFVAPLDEHSLAFLPASIAGEGTPRAEIEPGEHTFCVAIDIAFQDAWIVAVPDHGHCLAVLRCAELLGAAEHCFELAITYLKDRTQFGQPIGANQALKHLAADNYVALENVRVSVEYAAAAVDAARATSEEGTLRREAETAVRVMLAFVPQATREIAEAAIQFHGGIGLTWEYPLNRYLRRIVRLGTALGSATQHRRAALDLLCGKRLDDPAVTAAPREWRTA